MALPPEKVYVVAPPGFSTNAAPAQTDPLASEITGLPITDTVATAAEAETHPSEFAPLTEYEVVAVGETIALPPLNVYDVAPPGTRVNALPAQLVPLFTEIVGNVTTDTTDTALAVETQPAELVPWTV